MSFDSAARQIQFINHSFKQNSVQFQIHVESQIALQVHDQNLRTETFSFSDFFKGLLLSGGPLLLGGPLLSEFNRKGKN